MIELPWPLRGQAAATARVPTRRPASRGGSLSIASAAMQLRKSLRLAKLSSILPASAIIFAAKAQATRTTARRAARLDSLTRRNRRRALRQAKFELPARRRRRAPAADGRTAGGENLAATLGRAPQGRTETYGAEALHRGERRAVPRVLPLLAKSRVAGACPARSVSTLLFTTTHTKSAAPDEAEGPPLTSSRPSVVPSPSFLPKGLE